MSVSAVAFAAPSLRATTLEAQASAEFAAAGMETRARLVHEAEGDAIGADVAARNADNHRHRYLDLEHELERLRSPAVAGSRNPFEPDASFKTVAPIFAFGAMRAAVSVSENINRVAAPAWDLYGRPGVTTPDARDRGRSQSDVPSEVPDAPWKTAGDMYSTRTTRSSGATRESRLASAAPEAPRHPFRVYQERGAGDDPSE